MKIKPEKIPTEKIRTHDLCDTDSTYSAFPTATELSSQLGAGHVNCEFLNIP